MSWVGQNHRWLPCKGTVFWFNTCGKVEIPLIVCTFIINVIYSVVIGIHFNSLTWRIRCIFIKSFFLNQTQAFFLSLDSSEKSIMANALLPMYQRLNAVSSAWHMALDQLLSCWHRFILTQTQLCAVWMNDVCLVLNSVTAFLRIIWAFVGRTWLYSCFISWLFWGLCLFGLFKGWHAYFPALCIKKVMKSLVCVYITCLIRSCMRSFPGW